MATSPQGPGWWQASDGQWYPPELHPSAAPTAPQPPVQPVPPVPPAESPYGQPPYGQSPYGQSPYGQSPYGTPAPAQPPYGQSPHAAPSYAPPSYGQPSGPSYGQPPQATPPYGAVPPSDPAGAKRANRRALLIVAALLAVLLIAGLVALAATNSTSDRAASSTPNTVVVGQRDDSSADGGSVAEPDKSIKTDAPDPLAQLDIVGPSSGPDEKVVAAAIVDIQDFWAAQFPDVFGGTYDPVAGGFYSWSPDEPLPPCVDTPDNISENAFYCGDADIVAWDDADLVPALYEKYGDLSVAIVFVHEFGHAVQARAGVNGETVTLEQQADCFAGAWVEHVSDGDSSYFTADSGALDRALAGFIDIADTPGTSAMDPQAHGSAFDRINSFQEGLSDGAEACAAYNDQSVRGRLVELEFETYRDLESGGNAPYDEWTDETGQRQPGIVEMTTTDLEDYWSTVAQPTFGAAWTPLETPKAFGGSDKAPTCGDADTDGYTLFYCAPDNYVAYDNVELFPEVYEAFGDFAVSTLLSTQYALAAQDEFEVAPEDARDQNLMADCMTGSWAASVFLRDRESAQLILSPGDFDEAVKVLLSFGSDTKDGDQGSGFDRVSAFRTGVLKGVKACTAG